MCGLVGLWRPGADMPEPALQRQAERMAEAIARRGPDAHGTWVDAARGIALGHRRLAIVDLTPQGAQPMVSHSGRYVLVFNGEIYNFPELRQALLREGVAVRSTGDTEVFLEAMALWGVAQACRRASGMFAFALWDRERQILSLGRDRLGKKPLYVQSAPGQWAWASELKALRTLPGAAPALSDEAVAEFFRFGYVSDARCIWQGMFKVMPAQVVSIGRDGVLARESYWSLADVAMRDRRYGFADEKAAKEELAGLVMAATRSRMLTDVPLGAFLSGGIDSGVVVAMMQRAGLGTTRTFSIGFEEATHDEAPVARMVAQHLGTHHTELYVTQAQAVDIVPAMADVFDEPFADSSQIPTTLLAAMARQHVTVAMTGDGGDEAFGGYLRYRNEMGTIGRLYGLPVVLRHGLASGLAAVPAQGWDALAGLLPHKRRPRFLGSKVSKLARALRLDSSQERARAYLSIWAPDDLLQPQVLKAGRSGDDIVLPAGLPSSEAMQFWETLHYLPGDLLTKMDRATMWSSLEARSPLLDHAVVEFAWQLAPDLKAGPKALKYLLRELLFDHVPREIIDLPKQGFSVPIGAWMLTRLRGWVEDLVDYACRDLARFIRPDAVRQVWQAHLRGEAGQTEKVWTVVMFALWHRRWVAQGSTA